MKRTILLPLLLFALHSFAQRTFVRQNGTPSVYYQIDSVFLTAQNGDTIYLPGGAFQIGTLYIDKKLVIIGAGHYPDSTLATYATTLNGYITLKNGASLGSISGIYLTVDIVFGINPS